MKKNLFFVFALLLSISVSAQTPLTEAVNFKSIAHGGEEIELFEILDNGQYVILDFFFSTCGPCKEYAPRIVEAYYRLGSNEKDVYIMEISPSDHGASYSAAGWIEEFNIPYPTIHTRTGGDTGDSIYAWYQVVACPTLVLIAPDHKILLQDYKPKSAESFVEFLSTTYGIETVEIEGPDTTSVEKTTAYNNNFYHSNEQFIVNAANVGKAQIEIFDMAGRKIDYIDNVVLNAGLNTITWTDKRGIYVAKMTVNNEVQTCKIIIK